jgi:thiamine transport system ATP-binding protein
MVNVDVGGTTVTVASDRRVDTGDRVVFCVRPEGMSVVGDGGDGPGTDRAGIESRARSGGDGSGTGFGDTPANVLDATVSKAEFLGESTRSHLRWNGQEVTVRSVDPLKGDVRIGFDPSAAHVVETEQGRGP